MQRKKKVVVLVDWYLPGYKAGGPIQSVSNIVGHLKDEFDFCIITSDTDLHATEPYSSIRADEWNIRPDGSKVYYFSSANRSYSNLRKLLLEEQADVFYLNSLFSIFFTIYPLRIRNKSLPARRFVLAPRGMLGQGALNIKPFKKKLFLVAARLMNLYKGIRWHASSEMESAEIKKVFGSNAFVQTALNLTAPRTITFIPRKKVVGELRLVFISRIAFKKNLEGTLKLLSNLPPTYKISFDIYGPIEEPEYWLRCEEIIKEMPSHINVKYCGAISNDKVVSTLSNYHLSILLTFNENFGHSIVESLVAGCIILLSDQTPWKNLAVQKVGWDIPLANEEEIKAAIIETCLMDQHTFDQWSKSAQEYAKGITHNPIAIEQNRLLFA